MGPSLRRWATCGASTWPRASGTWCTPRAVRARVCFTRPQSPTTRARCSCTAGGDENAFVGPFFPDLWAYDIDAGTWSQLHDGAGGPIQSIWGDLVYDGAKQRLLLWGAHEDNLLGNNNKIWAFDLGSSTWTMLVEGDVQLTDPNGFCDFPVDFVEADLGVPERRSAGAAVLTDAGELMIFGGKTDCGIIDDVWRWSLADGTWTNLVRATAGEICVRAFAKGCTTMCF